jgi:hypothetical protein
LIYGDEAWTEYKRDESRIMIEKVKLMRREAGCTGFDYKSTSDTV